MIEFGCNRYHKGDMTPIVTDLAIQDYAEAVLEDYKPKLLKTPGKINALHFLESYLGVTVDYKDIYYKEGESPIAGATVFNDSVISKSIMQIHLPLRWQCQDRPLFLVQKT